MREIIAKGVRHPEAARWHEGAFWFSDIFGDRVCRVRPGGDLETVVELKQPSGIGWLPDGRLLVVSMLDQKLMRLENGRLVLHSDMSGVAKSWCNDMIVDAKGRAYVSCTGSVPRPDTEVVPAPLLVIYPDGEARVAAPDLIFPNGVTVTADNKLLYVAEARADKITRFDIAADGSLSNPTLHSELGTSCDGLAIDANDEVWVADPRGKAVLHLGKDGSIVERVAVPGIPLACALGGDDRDLLMACMLAEMHYEADHTSTTSWIEVFRVGSTSPA